MRPGVAVVICSRDREQLLAVALDAVIRELGPDDELVVVDSASSSGGVAAAARAAGARVVRVDKPGLGRARNVGWRATSRSVLVFTDDDCVPEPGWLDAAAVALADDRVGVVWGRVDGDAGAPVPLSTTDAATTAEGTLSANLTTLGHGANMAARRELLHELGGFDDELGVGSRLSAAEDKDLLWRAMRAGWRATYARKMAVRHVQWRGRRASVRQMYRYGVGAGALAVKRSRVAADAGLLRVELVDNGGLPLRRALRRGHLTAAAAAAARIAGVAVGASRARRWPLVSDRFSDRARR